LTNKAQGQGGVNTFKEKLIKVEYATSSLFNKNTLDEVIDEVYNILTTIIGEKWAGIGKVTGNSLKFIRTTIREELNKSLCLAGRDVIVRAVNTGEPQLVKDTRQDPDYTLITGSTRMLSEFDVPVKLDDHVCYVINVKRPNVRDFTEEDVTLIKLLGIHMETVAKTVENKQRLTTYIEGLQTLSTAIADMDLCDSAETLVEQTLDIVEALMKVPYSSYLRVEKNKLVTLSIRGAPPIDFSLDLDGAGVTSRAARLGELVLVGDTRRDPGFVSGFTDSLSELAVPVLVEGDVVGVINMGSPESGYFTERHSKLGLILAAHLSNNMLRLRTVEEKIRHEKERIRLEVSAEKDRLFFENQMTLEREKVKEAERLAELKTRFVSTASHELRTPLTVIQGYLELLEDALENDPESSRQYLGIVQRNVERLKRLTDDLLEQQRFEEDKIRLNLEEVNLSELVCKGQRVEASYGDDVVATVDQLRLGQVLVNLVGNASKFSPDDSVIEVNLVDEGEVVLFSVRDQGAGIREEDMGKLFKAFPGIRVPGVKDSTGLGLSICRGIVELHGGEIWAESKGSGEGSTFTFTIPK